MKSLQTLSWLTTKLEAIKLCYHRRTPVYKLLIEIQNYKTNTYIHYILQQTLNLKFPKRSFNTDSRELTQLVENLNEWIKMSFYVFFFIWDEIIL